nr:MAG TPA: hypothetical protein [Caudoviricetes sp.]
MMSLEVNSRIRRLNFECRTANCSACKCCERFDRCGK